MRARDTSAKAEALQDEIHRSLGPEGRFQLALRLSTLARELARAGLREKHPEYTEVQLGEEDAMDAGATRVRRKSFSQ
ncbi:MAG TPA: hypothetical protein VF701_17520 [Thermoanaerobaculia bacterium]